MQIPGMFSHHVFGNQKEEKELSYSFTNLHIKKVQNRQSLFKVVLFTFQATENLFKKIRINL